MRNPFVSCVGEPRSGYETEDADTEPIDAPTARPTRVPVSLPWSSGAGVAGLECARVLASRGARVRILEAPTDRAECAPGRPSALDVSGSPHSPTG